MLSAIRRRINPTTLIAVLALVFAMTGGAYAAKKYLITSTKQISPSVLKSLQGKAGVNGAQGAAGAAGPQGPAGPQGAAGPAGAKGETGSAGKEGPQGKQGATGATGAKGTSGFTETLPSGKTETGAWSAAGTGPGTVQSPISFAIPVEPAPTLVYVEPEDATPKEGCPGISATGLPLAEPGKLCIYAALNLGAAFQGSNAIKEEGTRSTTPGVGPAGTTLSFNCAVEPFPSCRMNGAWAVTAE
jgi:hypothetical protein